MLKTEFKNKLPFNEKTKSIWYKKKGYVFGQAFFVKAENLDDLLIDLNQTWDVQSRVETFHKQTIADVITKHFGNVTVKDLYGVVVTSYEDICKLASKTDEKVVCYELPYDAIPLFEVISYEEIVHSKAIYVSAVAPIKWKLNAVSVERD